MISFCCPSRGRPELAKRLIDTATETQTGDTEFLFYLNDDDEKLADNHRKQAKIDLKKEEIRKLEETHQALTKEAVKQQKIGASMKKVQHNLKIAKNVAKRVEDLKQQVQSDQNQLQ